MDSKESVFSSIRSLLNSSKEQMTVHALSRDYVDIIGSPVPFKKYGCQSLEEFLKTVPNLRLHRTGNEIYVEVIPDEKTAHIAKLVQGQNSAKRKKKKPFGRYRNAPQRNSYRSQSGYSNRNRSSGYYSSRPSNYRDLDAKENDDTYNSQWKYRNHNSSNRSSGYYSSRPSNYRDLDAKENDDTYNSQWKYRSSVKTEYDFSDHEEDYAHDPEDFDSSVSDEEPDVAGPPEPPAPVKEEKKYEKLTVTLNNTHLGAGRGIKVRGAGYLFARLNSGSRQPTQKSNVSHSVNGYCDDWDDSIDMEDLGVQTNTSCVIAGDDWDDSISIEDLSFQTNMLREIDGSDWDDSVIDVTPTSTTSNDLTGSDWDDSIDPDVITSYQVTIDNQSKVNGHKEVERTVLANYMVNGDTTCATNSDERIVTSMFSHCDGGITENSHISVPRKKTWKSRGRICPQFRAIGTVMNYKPLFITISNN